MIPSLDPKPAPSLSLSLSVAIITFNEAENLPRTLQSVCWADEIVVVDSGSTDATVEVARSFIARGMDLDARGLDLTAHRPEVRTFIRPWPGYAAQKNFALAQCRGAWILSLDADEELTPELAVEIQRLIACSPSTPPAAGAFRLKRRNLFLGRFVRHGGFYPDAKLRLFRNGALTGSPSLQFGDRAVHETIAFSGDAPVLTGDLVHHAYPTLHTYIEHMNRYSDLGAGVLRTRGHVSSSLPAFLLHVLIAPVLSFHWNYIFRLGFLDGREGLLLHLYQAVYTSWKYSKAWDLHRDKKWAKSPADPAG